MTGNRTARFLLWMFVRPPLLVLSRLCDVLRGFYARLVLVLFAHVKDVTVSLYLYRIRRILVSFSYFFCDLLVHVSWPVNYMMLQILFNFFRILGYSRIQWIFVFSQFCKKSKETKRTKHKTKKNAQKLPWVRKRFSQTDWGCLNQDSSNRKDIIFPMLFFGSCFF